MAFTLTSFGIFENEQKVFGFISSYDYVKGEKVHGKICSSGNKIQNICLLCRDHVVAENWNASTPTLANKHSKENEKKKMTVTSYDWICESGLSDMMLTIFFLSLFYFYHEGVRLLWKIKKNQLFLTLHAHKVLASPIHKVN